MPRTTLYENTHVLIDALLDPAGGLTLRRLTTDNGLADGYHVVLTIDETQALRVLLTGPPAPDTPLDHMAVVLSVNGYLVRAPDADLEPLLEALARQYGYGLVRPADPTQPAPPQPALVSHAELTQRMRQAIDHRDEALAARNGTSAARTTSPLEACRAQDTVLDHCTAADLHRQGIAVATEIRALLAHYRIPADSPYGDWSSELAKHEPQRWPDVAAQEGPGGHAGSRTYSER